MNDIFRQPFLRKHQHLVLACLWQFSEQIQVVHQLIEISARFVDVHQAERLFTNICGAKQHQNKNIKDHTFFTILLEELFYKSIFLSWWACLLG